jgi:hypothetical protein
MIRKRKTGVNSGAPEEWAFPVPLVATVVLLFNDTNISLHRNIDAHQYT